ncbi:MAG: dihydrolipoamide acetyltransferase family protein [Gemmatimonas sp.]|uniref:dihydrolipoamide acetyltransferase family protein n=1 Tax=Gemmatimonas sp. TaxID=1962908 RepID=UPI00391F639E|nr:2-oxo acid dehydrogenase subunit E2 [Gemmatimonadota bacterium]
MARVDVIMPQMGESIAEGTVSRWLKKVGDAVKRDEPIFEISTDKVDAEIPSPSAGVLIEIRIGEGQTVAVNTVVALLETDAAVAASAPVATAPIATAPAATAPVSADPAPAAATRIAPSAPSAPVAASAGPAASAGSLEERLRTKSSPLVRKLAAEHGVDLAALTGSGIAGRVTRKDLEVFLAAQPAAGAAPVAGASMYAPAGVESHGPLPSPWPGDVVEPMSKIRRLTADHMATARRVAAHVTTFWEIDLTRVARIRGAMRRDFETQTGQKLTYMPFILQAVCAQLKRHPVLNAAVAGTDIIYRKPINLGVAVALEPTGLIVPVLKRADELSLTGLTRGVNDLAARARGKKLNPTEVQDATFTITNPGTFGSLTGTPIIPVGTTAILCLGAIEKRPKVVTGPDGEDTLAIRTCCYFSLSFDHKVVDGADADRFMGDLKRALESIPEAGF